jgi:FkbM family methyltransferase
MPDVADPSFGSLRARIGARVRAYRQKRRAQRLAGRRLLRELARIEPSAFFIVVGANDGVQGDHLRALVASQRWEGIMIEPQPDAFGRLREVYAGEPRIILEQAAIADRDGKVPFYEIAPPAEGQGGGEIIGTYDLLGSLLPPTPETHYWIGDLKHRIRPTEVDCLRFDTLCRKHAVSRLDVLLVDTEGADLMVLESADIGARRPRLVAYEHALLTAAERAAAQRLMRGYGYELMAEAMDTWCLDVSVDDSLTALWRRLTPTIPEIVVRRD